MSAFAVVGSRTFNDYTLLKSVLDRIENLSGIVSGGATGVDSLAKRYAIEKNIPFKEYLPDYKSHARAAPIMRNKQIVAASDELIAFWDGTSRGTRHSIGHALDTEKRVLVVDITKPIHRCNIVGEPFDRYKAWSQYLDSQRAIGGSSALLRAVKCRANKINDLPSRYAFSLKYVMEKFRPERYQSLSGKDNVYLIMPTSSGNQFPLALANTLKDEFNGQIINNFAHQNHKSGMKNLSGFEKVFSSRSFTLHDDFLKSLNSLRGKNIVLVDDLISTGVTVDKVRSVLNKHNLKTDYICSLVCTSSSLTTDLSIDSIAKRITSNDKEYLEYRTKLNATLRNTISGLMMHLNRGLYHHPDGLLLRELVDKQYAEYVSSSVQNFGRIQLTLSDISFDVRSKHSLVLPDSIILTMKSALENSKISGKDLLNSVHSSIENARSKQHTWTDEFTYVDNSKVLDTYKIKSRENGFEAYRSTPLESKFLGFDISLENIKQRIEQFSVLYAVKTGLERKIELSEEKNYTLQI